MMVLGVLFGIVLFVVLGWIIVGSYVSHRHWRRVIAGGDGVALLAALEEAFETWRRMRPPPDLPPADWAGLQSAALVATDGARCRVSIVAGPDVRVIGGERQQVGARDEVARRIAVRMVERLLYGVPLARFTAVQVDVYAEYRSPDGHVESDCLLTTQVERAEAAVADWDDEATGAILAYWQTRELVAPGPLDPDVDALILTAEHIGAGSSGPGSGGAASAPETGAA